MLVEIAHAYSLPPKVSQELSKRQEGLSREVRAISWRAQQRLHRRFARLPLRGLHWNKVVIAVARELTAFIWRQEYEHTLPAGKPLTLLDPTGALSEGRSTSRHTLPFRQPTCFTPQKNRNGRGLPR
jgi:hypothetical protein